MIIKTWYKRFTMRRRMAGVRGFSTSTTSADVTSSTAILRSTGVEILAGLHCLIVLGDHRGAFRAMYWPMTYSIVGRVAACWMAIRSARGSFTRLQG
jgi:hypothetical protein